MKPETRSKFHAELFDLETGLVEMGGLAADSVKSAVDALVRRDRAGAQTVIDGDDEIDNRYLDIERRILDLFALQTPVASDLRLVSVIQHANQHLERVGDQAVNIAKINLATMELPTSAVILSHLAEMAELTEAGCVGFFQGNAPLPDPATLLQAMRYASTFGYTVWLRPQDSVLAAGGVAHEGEVATRLGLAPIPVVAETVAVRTILELMAATDARVHLARLSAAASVALVAEAKAKGARLTCDVGVNHLHLCDRDISDFDTQCNLIPPLRDPSDRDRLRRALADGTIDAVCSDHTPVDDDAKQVPFGEAEPGATALELLLPLTLQWGRESGLSLADTLGAVTFRAARILGVAAGSLEPGASADVCLFDPARPWRVEPGALASQGKNTPFQGLELTGRVIRTLVGGRTVYAA